MYRTALVSSNRTCNSILLQCKHSHTNLSFLHSLKQKKKKLFSFTATPSSASSHHVSKGAGVWNYGGSSSSIQKMWVAHLSSCTPSREHLLHLLHLSTFTIHTHAHNQKPKDCTCGANILYRYTGRNQYDRRFQMSLFDHSSTSHKKLDRLQQTAGAEVRKCVIQSTL